MLTSISKSHFFRTLRRARRRVADMGVSASTCSNGSVACVEAD